MKLIRLGDYLELYKEKCNISNLTPNDVSGINRNKEFFEPSVQVANDTSDYKVVPPKYFACNLMHVGRDKVLPISCNHTEKNKYVSPAYFVFKTKENNDMLDEYFFMYLKSNEKDRYFWFHTDSSVRDGMSWEDFCDIQIPLPPIEIQNKYVDIYKAMNENLKSYESNLEDLKLVCDAYIEKLRKKMNCCSIGEFLEYKNNKNTNSLVNLVQGVENTHTFINTRAKMSGIDIKGYKIVENKDFAYNPARINIGSIALREGPTCVVSPMYEIFSVSDSSKLLPEYLMLWFSREEFKHYTFYYSFGSVRDTFEFNLMKDVSIPIPSVDIQKSIVNIYNGYKSRIEIANKLKEKIDNICPILIAGAIKEAKANE